MTTNARSHIAEAAHHCLSLSRSINMRPELRYLLHDLSRLQAELTLASASLANPVSAAQTIRLGDKPEAKSETALWLDLGTG